MLVAQLECGRSEAKSLVKNWEEVEVDKKEQILSSIVSLSAPDLLLPLPTPSAQLGVKHYKLFKHSTAYPVDSAYRYTRVSNTCRRVILLWCIVAGLAVFVDLGECSAAVYQGG